jgi:hypothetical protein
MVSFDTTAPATVLQPRWFSMLATIALLASLHAPAGAPAPSTRGLVELTARGEVLFLARHHVQPFDGWVYARAPTTCAAVESAMLDVERWPASFDNIASAKAVRRGDTVTYELHLTVAFSPTIHGTITRVAPGRLRFNDVETKAYSEYALEDVVDGTCVFRYRVVEEKGRSSGWVAILKGLEKSSGDAGNFAAAISSSRGFGKPERASRVAPGRAAAETLDELAGRGTVVTIDRSGRRPVYVVRRRIDRPFAEVAASLRSRVGYRTKTAVFRDSEDRDRGAAYTIGGFGGRVSFTTTITDEIDRAGVLSIRELPRDGDLAPADGGWSWRVVPVEGGADVELRFACDVIAGSALLGTIARTDPIARESFMLHVALSMAGDLVPGRALPYAPPVVASSPTPVVDVAAREATASGAAGAVGAAH